jgi:transposase
MRARKGAEQATVATARKIARIVCHLLKYGEANQEESVEAYEHKRQERELRQLTSRAQKLGYILTPVATNQPESTTEPIPG